MISRSHESGLIHEPSCDVPFSCQGISFFFNLKIFKIISVQEVSLKPNGEVRGFRRFVLFEHLLAPDLGILIFLNSKQPNSFFRRIKLTKFGHLNDLNP